MQRTRRLAQTKKKPVQRRKVPEALPKKSYKESPLERLKTRVLKRSPKINEVVREPTAGGVVFRLSADRRDIEVLLIQDSKNRWTIPKGHIEPGETAKRAALREVAEEAGLVKTQAITWLGKINFKYRRANQLVLMTTQIYLIRAIDNNETLTKEKWMRGIKWFSFTEALDAIEYEDIEKMIILAKKRLRAGDY